jgi:4-diphosphocytidyl-2C-methyl-D-erythritol kinase
MSTAVRSHAKINLGLSIGAPRPDGFHALATVYQTLEVYDLVTVTARPAAVTALRLTSNNSRVPTDAHNTAWKMAALALDALGLTAEVEIHIEKRLPVQGGLGAGSANAVAALIGLETELRMGNKLREVPPLGQIAQKKWEVQRRFSASIAASRSTLCPTWNRSGAWWPRRRWASPPRRPFATGMPSALPKV